MIINKGKIYTIEVKQGRRYNIVVVTANKRTAYRKLNEIEDEGKKRIRIFGVIGIETTRLD